ncbi:MAG: hypothetical protein ACJAY7_000227 [Pseudohongiellaceae bacterium]|jgi:hypothetical protein|tara:strand:+ start:9019 stop:9147 length:129 start_codon:yes stop_codon:yes gene_type:complete
MVLDMGYLLTLESVLAVQDSLLLLIGLLIKLTKTLKGEKYEK